MTMDKWQRAGAYDAGAEAEIARLLASVPTPSAFTVCGVRALGGGRFVKNGNGFGQESLRAACAEADAMQAQFDEDCDPVRVYVFEGVSDVAIYAAGATQRHHRRGGNNKGR